MKGGGKGKRFVEKVMECEGKKAGDKLGVVPPILAGYGVFNSAKWGAGVKRGKSGI